MGNCFRMKTDRRHADLFLEELSSISKASTRAVLDFELISLNSTITTSNASTRAVRDFEFISLNSTITNDHTEDCIGAPHHSTNVSISSTTITYGERSLNSAFNNSDGNFDETVHDMENIHHNVSTSSLEENREIPYSSPSNADNDSSDSENTDIPVDFIENVRSEPMESFDENSDSDDIATPDISLELESLASEPERIYIDGETCGICANNFNEDQHRPWILPCGHTMCYYCVRKLAKKYNFIMFECPLDRKAHLCKMIYRNTDEGNISSEDYDLSSGRDFPNMEDELFDENNDEDPMPPLFIVNDTNLTNTEPDAAVNQREQETSIIFTEDTNHMNESELQRITL